MILTERDKFKRWVKQPRPIGEWTQKYKFIGDMYQDRRAVQGLDNLWGFVDQHGDEASDFVYLHTRTFTDGLGAALGHNRMYGFVNLKGELSIGHVWDFVGNFRDCRAWVFQKNRGGYINRKGDLVIPLKYTHVENFWYKVALVKDESNRLGAIDKRGNIVLHCIYNKIVILTKNTLLKELPRFAVEYEDPESGEILKWELDREGKMLIP